MGDEVVMIKAKMKRILALALVLAMMLPLMIQTTVADGGIMPVAESPSDDVVGTEVQKPTSLEGAMHFYIRHWHSIDPDSVTKGGSGGTDNDEGVSGETNELDTYFVVFEGYIVPSWIGFNIYRVVDADKPTEKWYQLSSEDRSNAYFTRVNTLTGVIEFATSPVHSEEQGRDLEHFAGFSISTGHSAVNTSGGTITVTYSSTVHLVKGHIFYVSEEVISADTAFKDYTEKDTLYGYILKEDVTVNGQKIEKGTVVLGDDGEAVTDEDKLPTYAKGKVVRTKVYNSRAGLHTDKTASVSSIYNDGRTFDLDLEAWLSINAPIAVGMVLDASGSMAFTAEDPTPININTLLANGELSRTNYNTLNGLKLKNQSWTVGATISDNELLTDTQLGWILNTKNTDNSRLGSNGYSYYVYDARTGTAEYTPLAYWDGTLGGYTAGNGYRLAKSGTRTIGVVEVGKYDTAGAGWYYINPDGNSWETLYWGAETAKVLRGCWGDNNGYTYYADVVDNMSQLDNLNVTIKWERNRLTNRNQTIGTANEFTGNDTSRVYTSKAPSPIKFYIDSEGYLRCFFNNANNANYEVKTSGNTAKNGAEASQTSYVYSYDDSQYTKVEALQRAIGAFVTKLNEVSPKSRVSATRFSTSVGVYYNRASSSSMTPVSQPQFDKLVLLDWTNDPTESAGILSLERGVNNNSSAEGGTQSGDSKDNHTHLDPTGKQSTHSLTEYNYGLTGSTSTWTGLRAFKDYLAYDNKCLPENTKKYLIVFTDGKDTDRYNKDWTADNDTALNLAAELRDDYTIFTVMLAGGPCVPVSKGGNGDYEAAETFLKAISSKNEYFFSTEEVNASNKVDALVEIFSKKIINEIMRDLGAYSVQDYIDPRFDLVSAAGRTWHLNADGKVVINNTDGSVYGTRDLSNGGYADIRLPAADGVESKARDAKLYYDGSSKMYYLKWEGQDIPTSEVGAKVIDVWKSRITVRAKDDFLGGNAVLSNGNAAKQNYVYSENELAGNRSSGTDDMYLTGLGPDSFDPDGDKYANQLGYDDYPSKGFPRTTLDVQPPSASLDDKQTIYEGEKLTAKEVAEKIARLFETKADELKTDEERRARYYWEYLCRYAEANPDNKLTKTTFKDRLEELIDNIMKAAKEGKGYTIPYYYLNDNYDGKTLSNQTGGNEHRADALGELTYKWTEQAWKDPADHGEGKYPEYPNPDAPNNGVTKDDDTRKSAMDVTYEPYTADQRAGKESIDPADETAKKNFNEALVNEGGLEWNKDKVRPAFSPEVDGIYDWDRDYKEEVGDYAEKVEGLLGTYQTDIVSGEIILQMDVSDEKVREALGDGTIKYKVELWRTLPEGGNPQLVGTFEVTYNNTTDKGKTTVTAKFTPEEGYKYVATEGLPIGTYELKNETKNPGSPLLKFKSLKNVSITEQNQHLFVDQTSKNGGLDTDSKKEAKAKDYAADYNGSNGAFLGTKTGTFENGNQAYLDDLYGLFVIDLETVGGIGVKKTVNGGDPNDEFEFELVLTYPAGTGTLNPELTISIGDVTYYEDGVADNEALKDGKVTVTTNNAARTVTVKFKLKNNEMLEIYGIPEGATYTVWEKNVNDQKVTVNDRAYKLVDVKTSDNVSLPKPKPTDTGSGSRDVEVGERQDWTFTNESDTYVFPMTGGVGTHMFTFAGALLLILAIPAVTVYAFGYDKKRK